MTEQPAKAGFLLVDLKRYPGDIAWGLESRRRVGAEAGSRKIAAAIYA